MTSQPSRIVRISSKPDKPSGKPTPCTHCGAWVADEQLHTEFHAGLESVMQRVAELLRQVIREDLPAYDALVPAHGDADQTERVEDATPNPQPEDHAHA
jgi:hypothetical protein